MTGKQIERYRKKLGLTRTEFSRMVGYSKSFITKIENDERKVPKILERLIECQELSKCFTNKAIKKAQIKTRA